MAFELSVRPMHVSKHKGSGTSKGKTWAVRVVDFDGLGKVLSDC